MVMQELTQKKDSMRLGGARADFVASLGRKVKEIEALLTAAQSAEDVLEAFREVRRKLHALGAGSKIMRFESMDGNISEAAGILDRGLFGGAVTEEDAQRVKTLVLELPELAWEHAPERAETNEPPPAAEPSGHSYLALIVGSPRAADALRSRDPDGLRFSCEVVGEPAAASEFCREVCPDIVVVDGDVEGAEAFVERVADEPAMDGVPVIVMGSFTAIGNAPNFIALGVTKTMEKPISHAALRKACESAMFVREGRPIKLHAAEPTLAELGEKLADEVRHALVFAADESARGQKVPIGDDAEVFGTMWGAIARVREIIEARTGGAVRFAGAGPEGAVLFAPHWGATEGAAERGSTRTRGRSAHVSLDGRTAIVADDDPAVVWFLSELLQGAGVRVFEANDGVEALKLAYRQKPDLVIADLLMPKLDGFSLCRLLKRDVVLRDVPVIVLSWKEDLLQRVRELRVGADGYLRKESDRDAILSRVREALRTRSRIEERLHGDEEVRGRLDGITVRSLLEFACTMRKNARLAVRDASFLYEVEIRDSAPVRATRSSAQGGFARGAQVIAQLLGVGAGRFVLSNTEAAVEADLVGDLDEQLTRPVALSRACASVLAGKTILSAKKITFDDAALEDYLQATPERAKVLLASLQSGTSPEELVRNGECDLSLLEDLLNDVGARGVITRVEDEHGEDRLGAAVREQLAIIDSRARGRIGATPAPKSVAVKARVSSAPTTLGETVAREGSDASPDVPVVTLEPSPIAQIAAAAVDETTDVDEVRTAERSAAQSSAAPATKRATLEKSEPIDAAAWSTPKRRSSAWASVVLLVLLGLAAAVYASFTMSKSSAVRTLDSAQP